MADNTRGALEGTQRALNAHDVPPGPHADVEHPIPVTVRLEFERGGEEWVDGEALEWTRELVRVDTGDVRLWPAVVWVGVGDVRRR
ncbi:hypothetical protein [Cellulomonas shaoxiangyii]|uniref:Uncharacterized protein n=1 Tax=Cellulomonas shaoxiangyii TaxID=2566013 RepID=A0A4P7SIE2_9CELL|nr:hypothetical protein [Cellulomonas shaoxiangyii]QCB93287.1 hypothetical protein E5225_06720 [Cellulomonas shaoxiangyii]TGY82493.1 hypothetical protein E5226_13230 [Cellulomonas shaoxiangyii]